MQKKMGIKKTWGNIILLFVIGMTIGIVLGLRQPTPETTVVVEEVIVSKENEQVAPQVESVAKEATECQGDEPTCAIPTE